MLLVGIRGRFGNVKGGVPRRYRGALRVVEVVAEEFVGRRPP